VIETTAWIRLNLTEGLGIAKKLDLVRQLDSPEEIFSLRREDIIRLGLKGDIADSLLDPNKQEQAQRIVERCGKLNIRVISLSHSEYPEMLRYIHDPPLVLYVKGTIPRGMGIGVVGSRKASGYGMDTAYKLSSELCSEGCVVVSGMARGIDTAAHTGALSVGGKTIAVLGCGPDIPYPRENSGLMDRIASSGAVISEYPPGTEPANFHFPIRNRIISGISLGVLVVEAGLKSGSLITAQTALEQGREVFAVPGNINHYNSTGANMLIKEGAKLVLSAQDILEEIPWCNIKLSGKSNEYLDKKKLTAEEARIIRLLRYEDLYPEQIGNRTEIPLPDLYSILFELELNGLIGKDITGKYRICG